VESKWKNYHIITFPGQSLSKTMEEAMDLLQDRLILELELASLYRLKYFKESKWFTLFAELHVTVYMKCLCSSLASSDTNII
jgi:hypothetical protein